MTDISLKFQQGFSLVIVMLLFLALTVVGIAIMRSGVLSEKQAINFQEKSATFHTAQSSNNGVINSVTYSPVVDEVANAAPLSAADQLTYTNGVITCVSDNGNVGDCGSQTYVDNNENGFLRGTSETFLRACNKGLKCLGNTADKNTKNGCNLFQVDGQGYLDNVKKDQSVSQGESESRIDQWATLVRICTDTNS